MESSLSGINRRVQKNELLVYRRQVTRQNCNSENRLLLTVGAVDQKCIIVQDDTAVYSSYEEEAKSHFPNGYLPIQVELQNREKFELTIIVEDTLDHAYPYGKQKNKRGGMWYTPVSGIWQTVWLEEVPHTFI